MLPVPVEVPKATDAGDAPERNLLGILIRKEIAKLKEVFIT